MSNQQYEPELKEKIIRLHLENGRTKKSLTEEYNLGVNGKYFPAKNGNYFPAVSGK